MTEQLALIPEAPPAPRPLTDRQQYALAVVERAGIDGIHTDELGAALCERNGKHPAGDRCRWCGKAGREVLLALKDRELVRYRAKLKAWVAIRAADQPLSGMLPDDQPIPF